MVFLILCLVGLPGVKLETSSARLCTLACKRTLGLCGWCCEDIEAPWKEYRDCKGADFKLITALNPADRVSIIVGSTPNASFVTKLQLPKQKLFSK